MGGGSGTIGLAMRGSGFSVIDEDEAQAKRALVDLLLTHGADVNARWCGDDDAPPCDEKTGLTALMTASDYWGLKTTPASWCSSPRPDEPLMNRHRTPSGTGA